MISANSETPRWPPSRLMGIVPYFNAGVIVFCSLFVFLAPGVTVLRDLADPAIRTVGIPAFAWSLHRDLSPKYAAWANARLGSARAAELSTHNISGTEWPLFGSVFYLWATESLQDAWEQNHPVGSVAPKVYARDAIAAATRLVVDPAQANWVKIHWGQNYLKTENVFYRMLIISAVTSYTRLSGDREYLPLLRDQADSLAADLGASPTGLLNDYPGECYPGDVLTAIAMIHRADQVLGTDHSAFVNRAIRGFQGGALDLHGLVPYAAFALRGVPLGPARGCGNSYVSLFSPLIWPDQARKWYDLYSKYYWQETWVCAGFREFANDSPGSQWLFDVDAGPVIDGFGCAACAFGLGAARVNGHFEQAYPLTAEMLATAWPLPNGTLLFPRLLSNAADAPYLGEAAILFNLTRLPAAGVPVQTGGSLPRFVLVVLFVQFSLGLVFLVLPIRAMRKLWMEKPPREIYRPGLQLVIWAALLTAFLACLIIGQAMVGALFLAGTQFLPRYVRKRKVSS